MRIAAISDIHANLPALRAVLDDVRRTGAEKIICLGDLVGYGPFPNEVIDLIRQEGITCVQGNYDEAVAYDRIVCGCDFASEKDAEIGTASMTWTREHTSTENKAFLRLLPLQLKMRLDGYRLHCFHGSPDSQTEYLKEDTDAVRLQEVAQASTGNVLLFGHTHLPYQKEIAGKQLINGGSVGKPKHGDPRATWVLIELTETVQTWVRYVVYNVTETIDVMQKAGLPEELTEKIKTGRA
ncbi:MAG: metallophosphoesterase family protein [Bacillota bacterium]|nr:metallophosphoesterase family protein [Bacillota bacterium]MDW7683080.1 metallophosphoesterase family protein [Bacillota bacterium]